MLHGYIHSFTQVNIGIIWNAHTLTHINSIPQKWTYICVIIYVCIYLFTFTCMCECMCDRRGFLVKIRGRDYKGCSLLPDWKQRGKSETLWQFLNEQTYRLSPGWLLGFGEQMKKGHPWFVSSYCPYKPDQPFEQDMPNYVKTVWLL